MASAISTLSYLIALTGIVITLIGIVGAMDTLPAERDPDALRIVRWIFVFFAGVAIMLFGLNLLVGNGESALRASGLTALGFILWLVVLQVAIWESKDNNKS